MTELTPTPSPAPAPAPSPSPTPAPAPALPPPAEAGAPAFPAWQTALADEALRSDETLARYGSIDDLAKGLKETMSWARGRIPIPKADDEKARADFVSKMRPENIDGYDIAPPEGQDAGRTDAFKEHAFQLGLTDWQAKALAEWSTAYETDAVSKLQASARDELMTRQVNLGPAGYARATQAIQNMLGTVEGVDAETAMAGIEQAFGAGAAFDLLTHFAEKTGELQKVDGADVLLRTGSLSPDRARAEYDRLSRDAAFFAKAKVPGSTEARKLEELNRIMAGG